MKATAAQKSGAVRCPEPRRARQRLARAAAAVGFAAVAAISAAILPAEIAAERLARAGAASAIAGLAGRPADAPLPLSHRGRAALLRHCLMGMEGPLAPLLPGTTREKLRSRCAGMAARAAREWPALGLARLVLAAAAGQGGAPAERLLGGLEEARRRAPAEGWQAQWRLTLAMRQGPPPSGRSAHAARDDIVVLAESPPGRALAQLYLRHPDWRKEITAALGGATQRARANFVSAVKAITRDRPSGEGRADEG